MAPRPVTIRLLDPPLHEFLPSERQLERQLSTSTSYALRPRGLQDMLSGQPPGATAGVLIKEKLNKKVATIDDAM